MSREAELDLRQAYRLALRHAHGEVELDAAIELLFLVGTEQGYSAAQRWHEEAWERAHRQHASPRARSWMFNNLGIVLAERGELEEAQSCLERALSIKQDTLGPRHPDVAISSANLGHVLSLRGRLGEALEAQQLALSIREEVLGPRHPRVADSLTQVGLLLDQRGELDAAIQLYERALAINEGALGSRHSTVAMMRTRIDRVRHRQGKGRALAEQALEAFAELGASGRKELAEVRAWLAEREDGRSPSR